MQVLLTLLASLAISLSSNAMVSGPGGGSGTGGDQDQGQNQSQRQAKKFEKVTKGEKVEICQTKITKAPKVEKNIKNLDCKQENDQCQSQITCQRNDEGDDFVQDDQQIAQSTCQQNEEEVVFLPEQSSQQFDVKEVELSSSDDEGQQTQQNIYTK